MPTPQRVLGWERLFGVIGVVVDGGSARGAPREGGIPGEAPGMLSTGHLYSRLPIAEVLHPHLGSITNACVFDSTPYRDRVLRAKYGVAEIGTSHGYGSPMIPSPAVLTVLDYGTGFVII